MIGSGNSSMTLEDIHKIIPEKDVVGHYLGIKSIPCTINSPIRVDHHPSLYLYSYRNSGINYVDYADGNRGRYYKLLSQMWHTDIQGVINRIVNDLILKKTNIVSVNCVESPVINNVVHIDTKSKVELKCKTRDWEDYDIKYWESYGISLKWLKWCEVYPISHKIFVRDGKEYTFRADKYAYVFIERKEGHITMKFYQPFNKNGFKWQNNNDGSVLGLWTKMPSNGKRVCICSSVKDAICLMANMLIPCICLQAEGYTVSKTAMNELKRRFTYVYICLDNDEAGLRNAKRLTEETGFINIEIPQFEGGKDVSDLYKIKGEKEFKEVFSRLLVDSTFEYEDELPF